MFGLLIGAAILGLIIAAMEENGFPGWLPMIICVLAASLAEAATRFSIGHPAIGTILVGMATPQEFENALAAVMKGPLPEAALDRLAALRQAFAGEPR